MSDFFDNSILTCKKILSSKTLCRVEVLIKLLKGIRGEFKVVAYYDYTMKWGRFCDGAFEFPDGKAFSENYLQELRMFNSEEEYLITKSEKGYNVRHIKDGANDVLTETSCVDTVSNILGDNQFDSSVKKGFAALFEKGRKIKLVIPVDCDAEHYALKMRSYITFDAKTGQAGYEYYRFFDIVKAN